MGSPGTGRTDLYVANMAVISGLLNPNDVNVSGTLTCAGTNGYRLDNLNNGWIQAGIITCKTRFDVYDKGWFQIDASGSEAKVAIGTATPRAALDVDGAIKIKTSSENVHPLSISAGNVDVDLSKGQSFTLTVTSTVSQFTLLNAPDDASQFTIKILQNSTGYSVDIDDFRNASGNTVDVYWPAGGVIPVVTSDANKIDIYSFKTFDSGASLYGIVGGQNFVA